MNIITRINEVYGGEVLNKSRTHINSICRIAYVGYLKEVIGLKNANIAEITNYTLGTVKDRLYKHRGHYNFDKEYKRKFDTILEIMEKQIILNRVQCKNCGEVLTSYNRHDYKTCSCPNETMVDGGTDYQRYGGKNLELVDTSSTIYLSEDHGMNRSAAHWGNRGKDGRDPLSYKSIADMSNNHIINILLDMGGKIVPWMETIMDEEINYRKKLNITIDD